MYQRSVLALRTSCISASSTSSSHARLTSVTPFGNLMCDSSLMESSVSGVKAHEVSRAGCRETPHQEWTPSRSCCAL